MSDCIFCDILNGSQPASFVYQDPLVSAFMDIRPVNPGHILVVPNQHASYLADLPPDTGGQMFRVGQKLAQAVRDSGVKCDGINFFLADGEAAMQEIFHVHLHVFPRFRRDGFGLRFSPKYYLKPKRAELDQIAGQIRKALGEGYPSKSR